jgi:pyridoxal phosphate enzyme (YggS family)
MDHDFKEISLRLKDLEANLFSPRPQVVLVSKGQPVEAILKAYFLGYLDFGENYVQELLAKKKALAHLPHIRFHMLGNLQSNKIALLVKEDIFLIQSFGKKEHLKVLEKELHKQNKKQKILLEIKLSLKPHDLGFTFEDALEVLKEYAHHPSIHLLGFMAIGPKTPPSELKAIYEAFTKQATDVWKLSGYKNEPIMSLGMSHDFKIALEAGSSMIRIGSLVFGERKKA